TKHVLAATIFFNFAIFGLIFLGLKQIRNHPFLVASLGGATIIGFTVYIVWMSFRANRQFQKLRDEEQKLNPNAYTKEDLGGPFREYGSKAAFLGLPLIHCRSGRRAGEPHEPAVGWIAFGDKAYGILLAAGGFAVGGIAMGGLAVGLVAVGGGALGALALG